MATDENLNKLNRKRSTLRSKVTRLTGKINTADGMHKSFDVELLEETLKDLKLVNEDIHDLLNDEDYELDVVDCEKYFDTAKLAIFNSKRKVSADINNASSFEPSPTFTSPSNTNMSVKLPTIKINTFFGSIEEFPSFWERFNSCIDSNASLSLVDKHVFLRGYLDGEAKRLVDGISVIGDTYETTKKLLEEKYGNRDRIIQSHLDYLENLKTVQDPSPTELNDLYIECNRRLQALNALGEDTEAYGRILSPKIIRAFPSEICCRWIIYTKREKLAEGNITRLMQFLAEEVEGAVEAQKIRGTFLSDNILKSSVENFNIDSKVVQKNKKISPFCAFCNTSGHWAQNCETVTDYETRVQKLKNSKRCFLCTNRGHRITNCPRKSTACCVKCKKKHHVSICPSPLNTGTLVTNTDVNHINIPKTIFTHLQTACLYVTGPTGITKLTRCILDGGSQASFVNMNLIDKLKLNVINSSTLRLQAFESSFTQEQRRCVQLQLSSLWNKTSISITAFESNNSYTTHPAATPEISQFAHQKKLKLADPPDNSSLPIELLIGGDYYWRIVTTESPIMLSESFVMVPSMFGWILSGSRTHATIKDNTSVHQVSVQVSTDCLNDQVRCLWELDSIGIQDIQKRRMSARDEEILSKFYNDYEIEDNRRIVSLTWKSMITPSPNLFNAESRFHSLQKRLASNDDLKTQYNKCMLNYIEQKHVEVCPTKELNDKPMHYLPHHAVKKKTQTETKWRIVFDASSHDPGMPSLNDTLEAGPNLLPEIVGCLLRFRKNEFAVTCDGKQAFLQLILHKKDRDFTRFLWYKLEFDSSNTPNFTNEIIVYRFTRLPFGLTCSPFLLCAATRELARNHITDFPIAAPLIDKHLYMDDFLASTETESHIMILYHEIENLMTRMKLSMEKWATNSLKLKRVLDTTKKHHKSTTVLGIDWDTNDDTLGNTFKTFLCVARDKPLTKRWLLRCIASCYDPLGLFTPFTIIGKIIFQDTWILGIKWDELLPTTLSTMWYTAMKQLDDIASIKIPRYIGISSNIPYAVHVFCDASERAYGSVLYIVTQSNVHIVCSRNRLAPIKKVTLPRLELLAALMGTRLLKYFCTEVDIQPSAITLWTDSKITLSWIRSDPNKWKTFVCNRTTEILQNTSPAQWRHCPGIQNPADHLSRGILPSKLSKLKNWWYGPHWLTQEPFLWPKDDFSAYDQLKTDSEARKPLTQSLCVEITNPVIDITHYSSYTKLLRVTAWVLRFCHYCKNGQRLSSELTAMELQKATDYWILKVQQQCFHAELEALKNNRPLPKTSKIARFNPFLKNNQIRLGGRLQFAPLSANIRHPLLLEGNHPFVLLLIKHTHVRLHHLGTRIVLSDLRSKFWILRGRQAIKQVLHKCLPCKLSQSKQGNQIEGPLPTERVTPSAPFSTTGIDFAGPLYVRNKSPSDIAYIALFTCAITRALHIELVSDLSTDKFLLALQRFVGRRGLPYTIYTDNASTFHAANKELILLWKVLTSEKVQQFYAHNGIHWKFIVPRAAWWGGWWERLIGLTKRCLRKAVGRALLDIEGLSTVLIGVEAALNSRPLVFEDGNEDSIEALTPAHFLTGKKLTAIPTNPENDEDKLTQLYKKQQDILDTFWKRWSNEYLLQLRSFHHVNGHPSPPNLHLGDVVLLQEDVRPRHVWKKGRIKKLIAGRDGKVRSCILRAGGKDITRPVQLIIPLEIDQGGEDVTIR